MDARLAFEVASTLCLHVTVVIAVAFMLQHWINDARWGCRLWTTCFISVIGLVAGALLLPHRRLFHFPIDMSRESLLSVAVWQSRIIAALAIIWVTGVAVSILRRCSLCVHLLRFLKLECYPLETASLLSQVGISAADYPTLSILTSKRIQGPFCWQLHRPLIVLPEFLVEDRNNDNTMLQHVLLHELEHLRTQHPIQHFLQGICSTLLWFHPLVWSAARDAGLTREYLCDEVAAKTAGKFGAYLRTLADVAERCGTVSCTEVSKSTLAFGNQPSALIRRSNRLVQLAEGDPPASGLRSIVAVSVLVLCAIAIQQVWLPTNAMASQRSRWSPWPTWTANALHQFDVNVRDFESFEDRVQMHELLYQDD
ncbi:M56 family metallopeptidase [Stieleria varia]|uniref:Regulatory protein BlaR1 n=1 Tax=Stieleria varia TaxID=2528005 RepID=A0A5C6AYP2_9BACT|nr:M56 family metallopeptidase [Stieleria varia]TWU04587.1 Regulatory protein BlaR1 [Stieleria varia]